MSSFRWSFLCVGILTCLPLPTKAAETTTDLVLQRPIDCVTVNGTTEVLSCGGKRYVLEASDTEKIECEEQFCLGADQYEPFSSDWWTFFGVAFLCTCCAATAAGLTLGLTSIDSFQLRVLANHTAEDISPRHSPRSRRALEDKLISDQDAAARILPLISGHVKLLPCHLKCIPRTLVPTSQHYLLVTLLVCNACANEALPVVLDKLVPTWLAVLLSVSVVLVFGEIVPSAIFTGPKQLQLAAGFSRPVRVMECLVFPIVWPISLLLDKCLGHDDAEYTRAKVKALVRTLRSEGDDTLQHDEANMLHGVLEMHTKTAKEIGLPLQQAKMLPHNCELTPDCIRQIESWGHSRVLIYRVDPLDPSRKDDIVGVLLVKKLIGIGPEQKTIEDVPQAIKRPVVLGVDDNLLSTLNKFQEGMCHMAIISRNETNTSIALDREKSIPWDARPTMFCSMEDVIEAIMKEEIYDEVDGEMMRWKKSTMTANSGFSSWLCPTGPTVMKPVVSSLMFARASPTGQEPSSSDWSESE